ncbi:uncharacterized protein LOC115334135 [Aquila chrysaetos chrysaetos]|uniref:uncharacterized protein LOC115334135 n=1 Tax=Aquila chrysaetos chrysaetos TaxID=223781 RepID=UPI001176801A|nr:uncharacterized protein LOC115334135 [Aquila chrysaetos chrysaetos]
MSQLVENTETARAAQGILPRLLPGQLREAMLQWRDRSNGEKGWPSPPSVTSGVVPNDPGIRGSPADGDRWGPVGRLPGSRFLICRVAVLIPRNSLREALEIKQPVFRSGNKGRTHLLAEGLLYSHALRLVVCLQNGIICNKCTISENEKEINAIKENNDKLTPCKIVSRVYREGHNVWKPLGLSEVRRLQCDSIFSARASFLCTALLSELY